MIVRTISHLKICRKFLIRVFIKMEDACLMMINSLLIAENKGLHPKHQLMKYHDFFVNQIKDGATVLDIGCGLGAVTHDLAKKARKVVGVDYDNKNIELAKKKFNAPNIVYIKADVTKYDFGENFDYAVLSNVLEHIDKRVDFLNKVKLLAPVILLRVPMINRDWLPLYKKQIGLFPYSDKTHFTEYTLESLKNELAEADIKLDEYSIQFGEIWAVTSKRHVC